MWRVNVFSCVVFMFWRDTVIYAVSASMDGLPEVVDILSDVVLRPKITPEEVATSLILSFWGTAVKAILYTLCKCNLITLVSEELMPKLWQYCLHVFNYFFQILMLCWNCYLKWMTGLIVKYSMPVWHKMFCVQVF